MKDHRIPKTFTVLPSKQPGAFATINGKRILEPTIATEDDQIGVQFSAFGVDLGSLSDPLNLNAATQK